MRLLTTLSVLFTSCLVSLNVAQAEECQSLTVTGHPDYAPIGWSGEGTLAGAGVGLVSLLAKDAGVAAKFVDYGSWADAQAAIHEGEADVIFGLYFNDERAKSMEYVEPAFIMDPTAIVVARESNFAFHDSESLVGLTGVAGEGESFGVEFDAVIRDKLTVSRVPSVKAGLGALLDGGADYMIVGLHPARAEAQRMGVDDRLTVAADKLFEEPMYVAFSKRSPCKSLRDDFGARIAAAKKSGEVDALMDEARAAWARGLARR